MPRPLAVEEIASILQHLTGDVRTLVSLMSLCGLRRNEAFYLEARDINLVQRTLAVKGKGNKDRTIPYSELLHKSLEEACTEHETGLLFPAPKKGREGLPRVDIRKAIWGVAKKAGIKKYVNPHLFRHS